jgi:hypothetical protein
MDAKRWSPLLVFVGGCLTGAVLIDLHAHGGPESASHAQGADASSAVASRSANPSSADERLHADPTAPDRAARRHGETPTTDATDPTAASQLDTATPEKPDAGNSVADVLAQLETEYRERTAPTPSATTATPSPTPPTLPASNEPARAPSNEPPRELAQAQPQATASEASAPKLATREQPAVLPAAAPAPDAAPSDARVATLSVDLKPTSSAADADEAAVRLASIRDEQAKAFDSSQQQLAQMQQLAALQQATLVQQYTLYQLQLLSMSPAPRTPAPIPSQRRTQPRAARIVASRPSSISATDNPWGFQLQPSVVVR